MNSDESSLTVIRSICSRFPEAEEDTLQDRPLFHVRRRRFVIFNGAGAPPRKRWQAFGRSLHFATSPPTKAQLDLDQRFTASPHHGFRGWMSVNLDGCCTQHEIDALIEAAYRHVASKELVRELERTIRSD